MPNDNLRLEPYHPDVHYRVIAEWWRVRGNKILPRDVLPPTGAIVTRDDEAIACTFVFLSNGGFGFIAFTASKPDLTSRLTFEATSLAIQGAIDMAKRHGCKVIWSTTENAFVDRIYRTRTAFMRTTPHNAYFLLADESLSHDMLVGEEFEGVH